MSLVVVIVVVGRVVGRSVQWGNDDEGCSDGHGTPVTTTQGLRGALLNVRSGDEVNE